MNKMNQFLPRDETLTAIVLGFSNNEMIADKVMPRTPALQSTKYKYRKYAPGQFAMVPDTAVGRRSHVNEVEFSGTEVHGQTKEYALKHGFAPRDLDGVSNVATVKASATAALISLVDLSREIRVAKQVMNPDNYAGNYSQLSANDALDNPDADIVKVIMTAIRAMRVRPNVMTMGQVEWDLLSTHPRLVAAISRAANIKAAGIATKEEVAKLFSLKEIIVGEALVSSSYGENAVFSSTWSGGIALHRNDPSAISGVAAGMNNGMTWGFTAHHAKYANTFQADHEGTRGVEFVRVVDDCEENVCAPECGFLLLTGK